MITVVKSVSQFAKSVSQFAKFVLQFAKLTCFFTQQKIAMARTKSVTGRPRTTNRGKNQLSSTSASMDVSNLTTSQLQPSNMKILSAFQPPAKVSKPTANSTIVSVKEYQFTAVRFFFYF